MSDELVEQRRRKLAALRDEGVEPFPHAFPGVTAIADVKAPHEGLEAGEETEVRARIAGRLAARRGQGKAAFLDVVDRSGRMQLHARADVLGQESLDRLVSLDLGDLIGADGTVFRTRRGELSLRLDDWTLLAKSLLPPPEKHHGLSDVETRYRQRELDLMANEESRELFMTRAKVITEIRRFLDADGFIEVETPILQPIYGGGMGRPFTTHHNELDRTLYMRIATELYLKRLIVGGLERVYEIGKDFRNEGVSFKHNPEFTVLEWYEAYADYQDIANRCEQLVASVAAAVGKTGFEPPWHRETLGGSIQSRTGIDIYAHRDVDGLRAAMVEKGMDPATHETTWARLVDHLLEQVRRARADRADVPVRLPGRALAAGQDAPLRARAGRALRGLRGRHGVRQRVHRAQRPGRPAPALRDPARRRRGRRRGGDAVRRGVRARARARHAADRRDRHRHRPPGDAVHGERHDPRGRAVPRYAGLTPSASGSSRRPRSVTKTARPESARRSQPRSSRRCASARPCAPDRWWRCSLQSTQ